MLQSGLRNYSRTNQDPRWTRRPSSPSSEIKPLISERSDRLERSDRSNEMGIYQNFEERIKALEKYDLKDMAYRLKNLETQFHNLELIEKPTIQKYTPYFINESHVGAENITNLNGNQLEIVVDIINYQPPSEPLIYPFGNCKIQANFKITTLELKYVTDFDDGIITGVFRPNDSDIYVIELVNFQNSSLTFPMTCTCKALLKRDRTN